MEADISLQGSAYQQPLIAKRWLFLAAKLEQDPSLLAIPLKNIARWRDGGRLGDTRPLDRWEEMIEMARASKDGLELLLEFLRDNTEKTRPLKSCSPFAGVLTREQRDQFTCAWTH